MKAVAGGKSSGAKETPETLDHPTRTEQIYEAAARVFCEHGFGQSSMSDVAAAMDMTKAGIYHHIASKDELLFGIMSYGMDLFEERVLDRVEKIRDPLERLRATIRAHVAPDLVATFGLLPPTHCISDLHPCAHGPGQYAEMLVWCGSDVGWWLIPKRNPLALARRTVF